MKRLVLLVVIVTMVVSLVGVVASSSNASANGSAKIAPEPTIEALKTRVAELK